MNTNSEKIKRMKEINKLMSKAADMYYNTGDTIMTDAEYDRLFDELSALEQETGIILSNSRTQNVGFSVTSSLTKVKHSTKMLSLDKTKSREDIRSWLGSNLGFLSWKLDGLTVSATYDNGVLVQAVTRGNGEIGEDITENARHIRGLPSQIPFKSHLVVRGEALIGYEDFEKVNKNLPEGTKPYKNPRNLASGTVRSYESKVVSDRNVNFYAFNLISAEGHDSKSHAEGLEWLANIGFQTVFGKRVTEKTIIDEINWFESEIKNNDFPSDGLVLMIDDVHYGRSLGSTEHHPRNGIAFKWSDETETTILREIVWSASRTGLLNPVAVFDSVELEGTSVSRASLHNLSIIRTLNLSVGDTISVYKANMIIPTIGENLTGEHDPTVDADIPKKCPVCGGNVRVNRSEDDVETLVCTNSECAAKHIGKFEHFAQREAMNIVGMAGSTIAALVENGFIKNFADMYHLTRYKDNIVSLEGFGEKSYEQMIKAIENSRTVEPYRVLYSLGIPNIGRTASRAICSVYSIDRLPDLSAKELTAIDGIGDVLASEYVKFFENNSNRQMFLDLIRELNIESSSKTDNSSEIAGKTFVITGSVHIWNNRNELKTFIESKGGKVGSSVSSKTNFLINNDFASNSGKNKKAKELGIPIITEEEFKKMVL